MMVVTDPIWMEAGVFLLNTPIQEEAQVQKTKRSTVNLMPGLLGIINSLMRL